MWYWVMITQSLVKGVQVTFDPSQTSTLVTWAAVRPRNMEQEYKQGIGGGTVLYLGGLENAREEPAILIKILIFINYERQ